MSEERFDSMERMLEQLIHMVGHNNAVTEELCQRMDRMETEVSGLKGEVGGLKSEVGGLKSEVGGLKGEVGGLKGEVSGLKGEVSGLKGEVSGLKGEVSGLKTRLDNLESKVDSDFAGLTGMIHRLAEKTEPIPRIEAKMDVLNTRLFEQEAEINLLKRAE